MKHFLKTYNPFSGILGAAFLSILFIVFAFALKPQTVVRVAQADLYCTWYLTPEEAPGECTNIAAGECEYCVDIGSDPGSGPNGGNPPACPNGLDNHSQACCDTANNFFWNTTQNLCMQQFCWDGTYSPTGDITGCSVENFCSAPSDPPRYVNGVRQVDTFPAPNNDVSQCPSTSPSCPPYEQYSSCTSNPTYVTSSPSGPYSWEDIVYSYPVYTGGDWACVFDHTDTSPGDAHATFCDSHNDPNSSSYDPTCCPVDPNGGSGSCPADQPQTLSCPFGQTGSHTRTLHYSGAACTPTYINDVNTCTSSSAPICTDADGNEIDCAQASIRVDTTVNGIPSAIYWTLNTSNAGSNRRPLPPAYSVGDGAILYPNVGPNSPYTDYILAPDPYPGYTPTVKWSTNFGNPSNPGNILRLYPSDTAGLGWFLVNYTPTPVFSYTLNHIGEPTVTVGDTNAQAIVTTTLQSGTSQNVTFTASGGPSGTNFAFSAPVPSQPSNSSTLTMSIPTTATPGTYTIRVTGTPAASNGYTDITLHINPAPDISVSCAVTSAQPAQVGIPVTWHAVASGGTAPYTFAWSGTNIPTPAPTHTQSGNTDDYSITYTTVGSKVAQATATDSKGFHGSCQQTTVQVNFNPKFKEF